MIFSIQFSLFCLLSVCSKFHFLIVSHTLLISFIRSILCTPTTYSIYNPGTHILRHIFHPNYKKIEKKICNFSNIPQKMSSELGVVLMVCGDQSGIGKTSACIGILNALAMKYEASEVAYIKPCTQCESVQLLWKFCHSMGIHCAGIGPIVYRAGYTQECIDGKHGSADDRLELVSNAILELRKKYKFVLVDGVGYPGVGSCVGCSNRDVAVKIGCPVLMISRPGMFIPFFSHFFCFLRVLYFWSIINNSLTHSLSPFVLFLPRLYPFSLSQPH